MTATECPYTLDPVGSDLHGESAKLREQGPTQVRLPGGVVVWSLNSHAAIQQVLTDRRVTKSARNHWAEFRDGKIPPDWELISWIAMDNMVTSFGSDHRRLRRLVASAFTTRRTESMRPRIGELVTELIDGLATTPPGAVVDLRETFAYPLPARLVADMIGMSEEARAATSKVIDMMVDTTVTPEQAAGVLQGWRGAMTDLIEEKRRNPAADITSDLLASRDEDGSRLTELELMDTVFAILGAGSETTINFFDNAISALLSHPDQLAAVQAGEVTWADVIDETLRVESPLAHLPLRYAVEDIEVEGVTIRQGEALLVNYSAVGRDPALNGETACEFDVRRENKEHLSFGHGPHYCLGAGIARAVATEGLSRLFGRFPQMRLATDEPLQPLPTFIMNGHRKLPVILEPGPN
ncbi:cytochrome P450 family protein [Myceligenerans xiligouense]|uniref:Cytochrome P450 n=1 Tax=Myceligenerans xiligouense TaxID=253184 RepID=A0A3N4ZJC2_9MICO|nr:cytochrome P450 [Myceligenerans xiligouense]RPF20021.1 cytochrome P450 [Myceligenerans xiligouense]